LGRVVVLLLLLEVEAEVLLPVVVELASFGCLSREL